ncbi:MAG: EamA family transporter [Thermodesulfobacteriota bacterium]
MWAETGALATALAYAWANNLARLGLKGSNALTGTIITVGVNFVVLWILTLLFVPWHAFRLSLVWIFIIDGLMTQALGRFLKFVSIDRLGAARSGAIGGSTPMFSIMLAVLIRGEQLTYLIFIGAVLIVGGLVLISGEVRAGPGQLKFRDIMFPLAAAFLYGLSPNMRKFGLETLAYPLLGAAVTSTTALFTLLFTSSFLGKGSFNINKRSLIYFLLAGLCTAIALPLYYYSLSVGQVVVVGPLVNISAFFSVAIAHFWMREGEYITSRLWIGALVVVGGAAVIFLH